VFDASARTLSDNIGGLISTTLNKSDIIDQLNAYTKQKFSDDLLRFGVPPQKLVDAVFFSKENVGTLGVTDVVQTGDSMSNYIRKLCYNSDLAPNTRKATGFNELYPPRLRDDEALTTID